MKPITIPAPSSGIAQSPHAGFGLVKNLDIYTTPGIVKLNNILAKKTGTTVDALIKWIVRDPDTPANIFALDSNGVLYKSADSGATWAEVSDRGGSGQGLMVKWGYVFVCEDTTIDVMKISDSSWTNDWQTIDTDSLWHPMYLSYNDGKIYGGAGQYVFSIAEDTTFAPGTPATYTFTQQALDLPDNYRIKCIAEQGNNLMVGTWQGTAIDQFKIADIYPWNRSNSSFNKPVRLAENGINAMINIKNSLYLLAGIEGRVYKSDGYNAWEIGKIPNYICDLDGGKYLEPMPGAIMNFKGRLFFGITGSVAIGNQGIYSLLETSSGNILNLEHTISTGEHGENDVVGIGALLDITKDELLCGWQDDENSSFGIDKTTKGSRTTGYLGSFETPLYLVGSAENPPKTDRVEINLVKLLQTNEGIKLEFRNDLTESYTDVITFDYTTYQGKRSKNIATKNPYKVKEGEYIQFRVSLTGTTTTPHYKQLKAT